ncbi:MAG: response regulator [Bacteroidota bacterium]
MGKIEIIKALIVDDEPDVRTVLRSALRNFSFIEVKDEAANVPEAVRKIHQHQPELVFLDIEMPGYNGLQLLEFFNVSEVRFEIIFVTAYDEYAIKAFKLSAFDYLLKPIDPGQLEETLNRYRKSRSNQFLIERTAQLQKAYEPSGKLDKIAISSTNGIVFISLSEIILFEASGTYTTLFKTGSTKIVASKPLGEFENLLNDHPDFFRSHRSFLINLKHIDRLETVEGDIIYLKNDHKVALSRYKKKEFQERIKGYIV